MKTFGFKKGFFYLFLGALAIFFAYRMIRPMNIFVVSEEIERPMPVTGAPAELEVIIRYHLLEEARRKRIGYRNEEPISYALNHYNAPL